MIESGLSFTRPRFLNAFYPELGPAERAPLREDSYDLLLLGPSVLHRDWGDIAARLESGLAARLGERVQVVNLATPSHTSRDSLIKYRALRNGPFDLVVVYHGINDSTLNNCSAERFRADYAHFTWYRRINAIAAHPERRWLTLPYTLHYLAIGVRARPGTHALHGLLPDETATAHGSQIKTAGPFAANIEAITARAARRGEPVMLMTFAYHAPPDYSRPRFDRRELDYGTHDHPIEGWGRPEHVIAAIEFHNAVIRRIADERGLPLVDQDALMPRGGRYFDDICHLTAEGCEVFASNLAAGIDSAR